MNQQAETKRIKLFSSGRLCLFGEHSDWAGQNRIMNAEIQPGRAIVTGIEQGIYAEAYRSEDFALIDRTGEAPEEFPRETQNNARVLTTTLPAPCPTPWS